MYANTFCDVVQVVILRYFGCYYLNYCLSLKTNGHYDDVLWKLVESFFPVRGMRRAELNNLNIYLGLRNRESLINPSKLETIV